MLLSRSYEVTAPIQGSEMIGQSGASEVKGVWGPSTKGGGPPI
jgi:hypothetical protein